MSPEETLKTYEKDVNAEANIRRAITEAYGDLRPELETVRTFENAQFPGFYDQFQGYGAGTGAADLSPTTLLQNAWADVAQKATAAQVARDVFDVRRAAMEDLIQGGLRQWELGYRGAEGAWDRAFRERQLAEQIRQFNLRRRGGGGSGYPGIVVPEYPTPTPIAPEEVIEAYNLANQPKPDIRNDLALRLSGRGTSSTGPSTGFTSGGYVPTLSLGIPKFSTQKLSSFPGDPTRE